VSFEQPHERGERDEDTTADANGRQVAAFGRRIGGTPRNIQQIRRFSTTLSFGLNIAMAAAKQPAT
jgi:hypothetical protein